MIAKKVYHFSYQKYQFWYILVGLGIENIDIFYVHLESFTSILYIVFKPFGDFVVIWYIPPPVFGILAHKKSGNPGHSGSGQKVKVCFCQKNLIFVDKEICANENDTELIKRGLMNGRCGRVEGATFFSEFQVAECQISDRHFTEF
jgi:hypothetical protein